MTISSALLCLALNVFHEARSESPAGQYAVAVVTVNRARQKKKDICEIVFEPYQFSWANGHVTVVRETGKPPRYTVSRSRLPKGPAWDRAQAVARDVLHKPPTMGGITYFHTLTVLPRWAFHKEEVVRIGHHIFYREPTLVSSL